MAWIGPFVGSQASSAKAVSVTRRRTKAEVPFTQAVAFGKLRREGEKEWATAGEGLGLKDGYGYE